MEPGGTNGHHNGHRFFNSVRFSGTGRSIMNMGCISTGWWIGTFSSKSCGGLRSVTGSVGFSYSGTGRGWRITWQNTLDKEVRVRPASKGSGYGRQVVSRFFAFSLGLLDLIGFLPSFPPGGRKTFSGGGLTLGPWATPLVGVAFRGLVRRKSGCHSRVAEPSQHPVVSRYGPAKNHGGYYRLQPSRHRWPRFCIGRSSDMR